MNFKKNIFVLFLSQLYSSLIGICVLPLYIHIMGAEAYGMIGFFVSFQVWFGLLDLGLTPTLSRETARFFGGVTKERSFYQLFRMLSIIFFMIGFLGASVFFLLSEQIAAHWLKVETLLLTDVKFSLQAMAICIGIRWVCGLYRGILTGSERLVWLGYFSIFINTVRFVFVLPVMYHNGSNIVVFFSYQVVVALLEIACLSIKTYYILPGIFSFKGMIWSLKPLRSLAGFSLTIAFTSSIWILITQIDKLILSNMLPLSEYGCFTLAALVASGIVMIISPVASAINPRLARLEAEKNYSEMIRVYRYATRLVSVLGGSVAITLAFFAEELLWAWTGDLSLAVRAAPILTLYSIGNGLLLVAAFPYYLQYAKGDLRFHFFGNILMLLFFVPMIYFLTLGYGAVGAGSAWVIANAIYLLVWVPVIHRKFVPGLHAKWFFKDILVYIVVIFTIEFVFSKVGIQSKSRILEFVILALIFMFSIVISGLTIKFPFAKNSLSLVRPKDL